MIKPTIAAMSLLLGASIGQAATFSHGGTIDGAVMDASVSGATGVNSFGLSITWTAGGDSAQIFFGSDGAFDLFLTGYSDQGSDPNVSAFTLDVLDTFGTPVSRIAGVTDNCSYLLPGGDCFVVTNTTATSSPSGPQAGLVEVSVNPSDTVPVISDLATGSYLFTFAESGQPENGTATFELRSAAPVPLPEGLPLLLTGLGGFALMRRIR